MKQSQILSAWRAGDTASLAAMVAEDATFSSPVADYHGRANVLHMFELISQVLGEVDQAQPYSGERGTVYRFTALVAGRQLEGVLHEERNEAGQLLRITLFLRPFAALRTAIGAMGRLLEQSPLPAPAG
ncbi:nuclear transport factor 2 family protein [Nocardia niwae]|uniref:nuclear transport factor 2 family protein n=1 Tax=Nocardia niwae TaxID=626084 RepID=UPI0007A546B0|nr:nuclear transport factor 2 family protein [Nocardia niwae]